MEYGTMLCVLFTLYIVNASIIEINESKIKQVDDYNPTTKESHCLIITWLESLWKILHIAVCFMKLHWALSEILWILWVNVMGLNSKHIKMSTSSPICEFIHDITSGEWQDTFWAIQIIIELIFYFIFHSNWISRFIHHLIYLLSPAFHFNGKFTMQIPDVTW
jgi:hypothetical protein